MSPFVQDFRYALRALFKDPGASLLIILTLAFGIGASTGIFSIFNSVVLESLPFPEAGELMRICETHESVADYCIASPPNVMDWAEQSTTIRDLGLGRGWPFLLEDDDGSTGISGALASPGFLQAFQVRPILGRLFESGDLENGDGRVAVLTHGLWQNRFGGARDILGENLVLDGQPYAIVGVLPADFEVPEIERAQVFVPLPFDPRDEEHRQWRGFMALGRLAEGADLKSVRSEMATLATRLAETHPETNQGWGVKVVPLHEWVVGPVRPTLLIFWGAVTLVLLIGSVNVANILLARAARRQGELALRAALGANRGRLIRQLLTEALVYVGLGGGLGLVLAFWAVRFFVSLAPAGIPRLDEVEIDTVVLAFTVLLSLLTCLLFAFLPSLRAARVDLSQPLKGIRLVQSGRHPARLLGGLAICEVALALVLLIGAGLLVRSYSSAANWTGGLEDRNLLVVWALASEGEYATGDQVAELFERAGDEMRALPGVTAVGTGSAGPIFGGRETEEFLAEHRQDEPQVARWFDVGPDYFDTLGMTFVAGRGFTSADRSAAPRVAIVNQTMVRKLWPKLAEEGRHPIGERLRGVEHGEPMEVVGVVADVTPFTADGVPEPEIYWPNTQWPRWATYFLIQTESEPHLLAETVRDRLREVDSNMDARGFRTFEELIDRRLVRPRFNMTLLMVFAILALFLAVGGTYGVIAYGVSQRRHEFGLRMALGATPGEIRSSVVGRGLVLTGIGLGLGILGSLTLNRFLSSLLFGVAPHDLASFVGMTAILTAVAILAFYVPARRAAAVDPNSVLRTE